MRRLSSSLAVLTLLVPASAFAQVSLEEEEPAAPSPAAPSDAPDATSSASATTPPAAAPPPVATTAAVAEPAPAVRPQVGRTIGGPDAEVGSWQMTYSGYFRAPLRFGIGDRTYDTVNADGSAGTKGTTLHSPLIPDDQYSSWQFSPHNKKDWAEMFFTMGNGIVSGTLAIQSFQFTDPNWAYKDANFGIGQGWIEINHDLGFENVKFNAKVGAHWNRYGRAGVYDAGEYDTYLFGRTHVVGGTARVDFDLDGAVLGFEGGFGGNRPNPEMFNRARFTTLAHGHAFLKLDEMEFSAHLMHAWSAQEVVPNYPNVLPGSNCGAGAQCIPMDYPNFPGGANGTNGVFGNQYPNGSQTVFGADARLDLGIAGYLYGGFSHQILRNALVVGPAIESIHSLGAGNYTLGIVDNYLESTFCPALSPPVTTAATGNIVPNGSCSNGDGAVSTILAQYELGMSNFDILPGDQDLRFKLYGMLNFVSLADAAREQAFLAQVAPAGADLNAMSADGVTKLKFGVDAEYFFLPWMSAGVRFDRLSPNNKIPEQAFMILSPRITFRSQMVTREQISIQYSRYMYAQRECFNGAGQLASPADAPFRTGTTNPQGFLSGAYESLNAAGYQASAFCVQPPSSAAPPDGFGSTSDNQATGNRGAASLTPDVNVIKIEASMWW